MGRELRMRTEASHPRRRKSRRVREVLRGRRDNVRVVDYEPGTLMVFHGHYTLHRVSPVRSSYPRLIPVMNYKHRAKRDGRPAHQRAGVRRLASRLSGYPATPGDCYSDASRAQSSAGDWVDNKDLWCNTKGR